MSQFQDRVELDAILSGYDPAEVFHLLCALSSRHMEKNIFRVMEFDVDKPYHRPQEVEFEALDPPWTNEAILPFGPAVHPGFSVIIDAWRQHPDLLSFIGGEMRHRGRNFTLMTNHGALFDIALVLGGLRVLIERWLRPELFTHQSTLIVSGGVRPLEVVLDIEGIEVVLPVIEVLQYFTQVLTSFPTTMSVKSVSFDPDLVTSSNKLVRLAHSRLLERGGQMVAIAPSASEDRLLSDRKHMQPLKDGTMELMIGTWAIPVAITLDGDEPPACTVLEPRWLDEQEDCHSLMEEIARQCHRQSLVGHVYHRKPTLYQQALTVYGRGRRHH